MFRKNLSACAVIAGLMFVGCQQESATSTKSTPVGGSSDGASEPVAVVVESFDQLSERQQEQHKSAMAAKEALFTKLSGRLMSAIEKDGAAAAIEVCKSEAPAIAEQVKREFGVNIGRTSFKLRNSTNPPPDWAIDFVAERADSPRFVELGDESLGVFLPIRLQQKCLLCHGPKDQIAADVKAALELQYPNDQATGFHEGDLRGWFWVEVPATNVAQAVNAAKKLQ